MKETFKQKMEAMLKRLDARLTQLQHNIKSCKESDDFTNALYNQIKFDQLKMVADELREALSEY